MIFLIEICLILLISIFLISFTYKNSILIHSTGEPHQNFIKSKQTPLIGGIVIFIFILIDYKNLELSYLFVFLILMIGILSDSRKVKSAYLRLFIQFLLVVMFIYFYEMNIETTRIFILDNFLDNYFFSILFSAVCVLIIINGTNFIDGSNLLAVGYFLILELVLIILNSMGLNFEGVLFSHNLITVLLVVLFFNSINRLYLGDAGSYLLGFIYSFKCISLYLINPNISPFFIALILWYPTFEILFSILRKLNFNRSPIKPDSNHLHQLIYFVLNQKVSNNTLRSNLVGIIINIYNLILIIFSLVDIYNTQYQIILFMINVSVYVFVYIRLLRKKLRNNF